MRAAEGWSMEGMSQEVEKKRVAKAPFVAFLILTGLILAYYMPRYRVASCDDPIWYHRSVRWPFHAREDLDYRRAIDVPALNRWVYGIALHAAGLANEEGVASEDVSFQTPKRGTVIPSHLTRRVALAMRGVNVACLMLYYGCLAWVAVKGLGSWRWAAAPLATVLLPPGLRWMTAFRIGPDVFLLAGYAAFLAVWVRFHVDHRTASWASAMVLGALGGAVTSAKLNGGLAVLAYATFVLWTASGARRFWLPLVACVTALITFMLLNPVFYVSGRAPWTVLADMLARRAEVIANVSFEYPHSKWYTITAPFTLRIANRAFESGGHIYLMPHFRIPLWLCIPAGMLAQVVAAQRHRWMQPVACWGIVIFIGNAAAINIPVAWYVAPMLLAVWYPIGAATAALGAEYLMRRRGRDKTSAEVLRAYPDNHRGGDATRCE